MQLGPDPSRGSGPVLREPCPAPPSGSRDASCAHPRRGPVHPHSSSRLLFGSLGLVILVAVGCVPIPTGPSTSGHEPRLRTSDPRERLPLPELDSFASPDNPALDENSVAIRQAAFDAEFRPIDGSIGEVAAPTRVPDDFSGRRVWLLSS